MNYLREHESDSLIVLKFLKQLPHSMFDIYQKEIKSLDKKESKAHALMIEDLRDSFMTAQCDTANEPEFLKKYAHPHAHNLSANDQMVMTHDIIGKPLVAFYRQTKGDG